MPSILKTLLLVPAFAIAGGCSKDKPADPSLNNDLTLAAQARQNSVLDSITAAERVKAAAIAAAPVVVAPAPLAAAPARTSSAPRRTSSAPRRRSASSSSGSSNTSSGTVVASEPRTEVVKHTNRDAAIGAAAGAIIGATTSRDKVKGGIIGAAAGGILGGVIGNNVDKQKRKVP